MSAYAKHSLPRRERDWGSDYVQDALMEAHRRAEFFRRLTPDEAHAWLLGVLKRKMANASRARRQDKRDCCREFGLDALTEAAAVDAAASPVEMAVRREQDERIDGALSGLTDGQRLAIVLHFYGKATLEVIAERLGIARSSVLGLIRRGLSHLAKSGVLSAEDLT